MEQPRSVNAFPRGDAPKGDESTTRSSTSRLVQGGRGEASAEYPTDRDDGIITGDLDGASVVHDEGSPGWFHLKNWTLDAVKDSKALHIACIIAKYADNTTHRSFPGFKTIIRYSGMGRATITQKIKLLEEAGVIRVHRKFGGVNHYKINRTDRPYPKAGSATEPVKTGSATELGGSATEPLPVLPQNRNYTHLTKLKELDLGVTAPDGLFVFLTSQCKRIRIPESKCRALSKSWHLAYPGVDLPREILKAEAWLEANGRVKSNYARFLDNWFKRALDRLPGAGRTTSQAASKAGLDEWLARSQS